MSNCIGCGSELTTGDVGNLCNTCEGRPIISVPKIFGPAPGPLDPPPEYPPFEPTYYAPWVCPRCGTVHAPWVSRCDCPPPSHTSGETQLRFSF